MAPVHQETSMLQAERAIEVQTSAAVPLKEKVGYGFGDFSSNLLWGASGSFLMYFYTDVYQLPAASVAVLLLIVRCFDALMDPAVGYVIDRSRGALVLPLIKWLAIPFGLVGFLAFLPLPGGPAIKLAWAYLTYLLFGAIYSAVNTPYGILGNMMTSDSQGRVDLGSFRMIGALTGLLLISTTTFPGVHLLGGGQSRAAELAGFPRFMAIIGVVAALSWAITYKTATVRHEGEHVGHSIAVLIKSLARNWPWIVCNAAFGVVSVIWCVMSALPIYYAKVVMHRSAEFGGYLLTVNTLAAWVGTACTPAISRRLGRRASLLGSTVLMGISMLTVASEHRTEAWFIAAYTVASFGLGVAVPLLYAMLSDTIDYGAARTGVRAAGLAYSINSLTQKIATAVSGAALAWMLDAAGYDPNVPLATTRAALWITAGFAWIPALSCAVILSLVLFYPTDAEMESTID
jgi:glycoside/pentoside/hexuronide:cation symporter, GPH family